MTKIELQKIIVLHNSLLERATRMLNERFEELQAHGEEINWLEEYLKQQRILDWLREQKTDD